MEAELGTPLLGQLSAAEQAEVRRLQPQVAQLQVRRGDRRGLPQVPAGYMLVALTGLSSRRREQHSSALD